MKAPDNFKRVLLATTFVTTGLLASLSNASAYVACNRFGDCWHTDSRVHFPHVRLSFHPDSWWDHHKTDGRYTWHEIDGGHDWHHGYWDHGTWHAM